MAKMIDCPYCGKLTDPNLGNCPHCGGSLAHKNVVPTRVNLGRGRQSCPSCRALVADGDIICVACGTNLLTGQKVSKPQEEESAERFEPPPLRTIAIGAGVLAVVVIVGIWGYYVTRDPKAQAARLIEGGSYIEAMELLEEYVADSPDDSQARITLGQLQYRNNRHGSAATSFEEALRLHPSDLRAAYWALASVIRAGGDDNFARRRQLLENIVKLDPSEARAWYLLSLVRGAAGDADGRRRALEQYITAGGDRALYEWNLGLIQAQNGALNAAEVSLESALGSVRDADAKAAIGMVTALRGQIAEAQVGLEEAASSDELTVSWETQAELGKLYLARGEFAKALAALDNALAENPSSLASRYYRGVIQSATNRDQQALQDFEYLINIGREFAYESAIEAARLQLTRNDLGRAIDFLNRAARTSAPTADYYVIQGRIASRQNNAREADRNFALAIQTDPNLAEAYLERGLLNVQMDRVSAGIADLQRYVQLVDNDVKGTEVVEIRELIMQLRRTSDGAVSTAQPPEASRG